MILSEVMIYSCKSTKSLSKRILKVFLCGQDRHHRSQYTDIYQGLVPCDFHEISQNSYFEEHLGLSVWTVAFKTIGGKGSNKIHQGENYQDFLKWGEGVFRSFSYNNSMYLRVFFAKICDWIPPTITQRVGYYKIHNSWYMRSLNSTSPRFVLNLGFVCSS